MEDLFEPKVCFEEAEKLSKKGAKLAEGMGGVSYDKIEPIYRKDNWRGGKQIIGVCLRYKDLKMSGTGMFDVVDLSKSYLDEEENNYDANLREAKDLNDHKINGRTSVVIKGAESGRKTEIHITPDKIPMYRRTPLGRTIAGFCDNGYNRELHRVTKNWERFRMKKPTIKNFLESKSSNTFDVEVRMYEPTQYDYIGKSLTTGLLLGEKGLMPKAKRYTKTIEAIILERQKKVNWDSLGGHKLLKSELYTRLQGPIVNPTLYKSLDLVPPNILFTGPPGTGKTLMSNILINELEDCVRIPYRPDFISPFLSGKAEVSQFFSFLDDIHDETGQMVYCFYDELEDVGNRFEGDFTKVINEFLRALDGSENHGFRIIGTSNKPTAMDPALFRPKRIYPIYYFPAPSKEDRHEILEIYARRLPNYKEFDITDLAKMTDGYTGAHLEDIFVGAKTDEIIRLQHDEKRKLKDIKADEIILTQKKVKAFIKKKCAAISSETNAWNSTFNSFKEKLGKGSVIDGSTGNYIQ